MFTFSASQGIWSREHAQEKKQEYKPGDKKMGMGDQGHEKNQEQQHGQEFQQEQDQWLKRKDDEYEEQYHYGGHLIRNPQITLDIGGVASRANGEQTKLELTTCKDLLTNLFTFMLKKWKWT